VGSAVIVTLVGLGYFILSLQYDIGNIKHPGPGMLPVLLGLSMILVGIGLFSQGQRIRTPKSEAAPARENLRPAILVVIALLGYALLWPVLGTVLGTFLLFVVLSRIMGAKSWMVPITLAALFAIGLFWSFGTLLDVTLPEGVGVVERFLR
jgi:putative tricarboxylic transport membrane protein